MTATAGHGRILLATRCLAVFCEVVAAFFLRSFSVQRLVVGSGHRI